MAPFSTPRSFSAGTPQRHAHPTLTHTKLCGDHDAHTVCVACGARVQVRQQGKTCRMLTWAANRKGMGCTVRLTDLAAAYRRGVPAEVHACTRLMDVCAASCHACSRRLLLSMSGGDDDNTGTGTSISLFAHNSMCVCVCVCMYVCLGAMWCGVLQVWRLTWMWTSAGPTSPMRALGRSSQPPGLGGEQHDAPTHTTNEFVNDYIFVRMDGCDV